MLNQELASVSFWSRRLMVPWDGLGEHCIASRSVEMICAGEATPRVTCPGLWLVMLGCPVQERQGAHGEGPGEGYKVHEGTGASL